MKYIHIPTLVIHLLLLVLARLTIGDYPDFFLGCAIVVLILHLILSIVFKRKVLVSHILGCSLYLLALPLGIITFEGGFWSMGSEFGWLFYGIALAVSLVLHSIICFLRWLTTK